MSSLVVRLPVRQVMRIKHVDVGSVHPESQVLAGGEANLYLQLCKVVPAEPFLSDLVGRECQRSPELPSILDGSTQHGDRSGHPTTGSSLSCRATPTPERSTELTVTGRASPVVDVNE